MNDTDISHEFTGTILLTQEGYERLQKELEYLTTVKRPEIADRIRESQQHGEFSEDNQELDEVKFEQAMVENRIGELKTLFAGAQTIEDASIPTDYVGLGSFVTVDDAEFSDEFEVRVVSSVEADPTKDLISIESPLGTALMGGKKGQDIKFEAPEGKKLYKILNIRA
jgi:transcription elongation factor GreA